MNTPICDYVENYIRENPARFHMPGHKGKAAARATGDITEIDGADVLYDSDGIIRESEKNAAMLFGSAKTVYSAEGSSLCIRSMLYLAEMYAKARKRVPRIAAGRNAHRVFLEAAALLDLDVNWLGTGSGLLHAEIRPEELEAMFADTEAAPTAVYLTSPDYLGNMTDLRPLAELCHRHHALFLVDNAHGAYLKFLPESRHPLDCGADLCCDSAHKTLPALTGGAYLHASRHCPKDLLPVMERAMALFASTSPSWLILQSLDAVNALLAGDYPMKIRRTADRLTEIKKCLTEAGWQIAGQEPLKLTLCPKNRGYTGTELGKHLREQGIVCEFSDPDDLVIMVTPENTKEELQLLETCVLDLPPKAAVSEKPPLPAKHEQVLRPHEVLFLPFERIPTENSLGRILASPSVSCPPAVPICICGERIDENVLELFQYYGIKTCDVVKD